MELYNLREELREDILSRYDNEEYWDMNAIQVYEEQRYKEIIAILNHFKKSIKKGDIPAIAKFIIKKELNNLYWD